MKPAPTPNRVILDRLGLSGSGQMKGRLSFLALQRDVALLYQPLQRQRHGGFVPLQAL